MKKQDLKQLPLSQAAFPVSPSPPQGSEGALRMNATCGRKCAALLPSYGPVGCLGKMLLDIAKLLSSVIDAVTIISNLYLKEYYQRRNRVIANYYFNKENAYDFFADTE